jgi:thiosulfate dehydrogenase
MRTFLLLTLLLLLCACSDEPSEQADTSTSSDIHLPLEQIDTPIVHVNRKPAPVSTTLTSDDSLPLIPRTARADRVNDLVRDPFKDPLPDNPYLAEQIKLGFHFVRETGKYAGKYVGNKMACANCHMNGGQRELALPYVGIAGVFPLYRNREGRLFSLEDRIRGCFMRSINGIQPPYDSPELLAVSAYITWLSEGFPSGTSVPWRGKNKIAKDKLIPIWQLDPEEGERLYMKKCIACHGADGQGVDIAVAKPGPLWGPGSWNDGAGLGRIYTLAGYIRYAMPLLNPGSLSDYEAQQIAAFVNSHERPVYPNKARDWPKGDTPIDAVYYPLYNRNPMMK